MRNLTAIDDDDLLTYADDVNAMWTWAKDGFTVNLFWRGIDHRSGKSLLAYQLFDGDTLVFEEPTGQLGLAPGTYPDSDAAAFALLGFLTLQPGDTDEDFFQDYTPAQLNWSTSLRAEELRLILDDYENPETNYNPEI